MNLITKNVIDEIIIKKSKFITYLIIINNKEEIKRNLENIKNKYKDSSHICYAYILDNQKKYDDNNEPNGTAGIPILNILEKKELNNILAVVIRYFGGIKLGAGGLIRAYSSSVKEALNKTDIKPFISFMNLKITCNYENIKMLNNEIKNEEIIDKTFDKDVTYIIKITCDKYNKITSFLDRKNIKWEKK